MVYLISFEDKVIKNEPLFLKGNLVTITFGGTRIPSQEGLTIKYTRQSLKEVEMITT